MKVLLITPSYYPVIGGTETFVQYMAQELRKLEVQADILTFNMDKRWYPKWDTETLMYNGINTYKIPGFTVLSSYSPLDKLFKINVLTNPKFLEIMNSYDILHFNDDMDLSFPIFSYFIKKPKIFHYHTLSMTFDFYRKNPICKSFLNKNFDIHISNSKSTLELLQNLGIHNHRLLYNGVDTEKFIPCISKKKDNLLLYVGRITPRKGLHILVDSLRHLKIPVKLAIIGPVSSYDSAYFDKISMKIEKERIRGFHNIEYLGALDHYSLIEWYQMASVFVCPSLVESLGIVNLEALSCGTPVIASDVGGIPEIVRNQRNGLLVPPEDALSLANAIEYLFREKELLKEYGINGRELVLQRFSWNAICRKLKKIYDELC